MQTFFGMISQILEAQVKYMPILKVLQFMTVYRALLLAIAFPNSLNLQRLSLILLFLFKIKYMVNIWYAYLWIFLIYKNMLSHY